MKILFENKALDATFSCLNQNVGYSVDNITHQFLKKRFQSTSNTDTITGILTTTESISCFFYGLTNAIEIVLKLYSAADILLHTEIITDINYIDSIYFTSVEAKYFTIELTTTDTYVYLGGIGIGNCYTMPDIKSPWDELFEDNSIVSNSIDGQVLQNYFEPLKEFKFNIPNNLKETKDEIKEYFVTAGRGGKIWIDLFEDNHDFFMPMYAIILNSFNPKKNGIRYSFDLQIREAR